MNTAIAFVSLVMASTFLQFFFSCWDRDSLLVSLLIRGQCTTSQKCHQCSLKQSDLEGLR